MQQISKIESSTGNLPAKYKSIQGYLLSKTQFPKQVVMNTDVTRRLELDRISESKLDHNHAEEYIQITRRTTLKNR
jgi:hypothetical protein